MSSCWNALECAKPLRRVSEEIVEMKRPENPFKIGDRVKFVPDERTTGWSYATFVRVRLKPGDIGTVTRIAEGQYLYLDDSRGGFHWQCFTEAS
jgi:ATP-dependent exoDNAse (exonuclease V) alpha subunit